MSQRTYHPRMTREQRLKPQNMRMYRTFEDDMAVIYGVILKGSGIVILESLQRQALEHLHVNQMKIGKTKLVSM